MKKALSRGYFYRLYIYYTVWIFREKVIKQLLVYFEKKISGSLAFRITFSKRLDGNHIITNPSGTKFAVLQPVVAIP